MIIIYYYYNHPFLTTYCLQMSIRQQQLKSWIHYGLV